MSANVCTPDNFSLFALAKRAYRVGREMHDISRPQLAQMIGLPSASLVRAWEDNDRENAAPLWPLMHARFPSSVRAFVLAEIARVAGDTDCPSADTPEAQTAVAIRAAGQFLIVAASAVTVEQISAEYAAQLLVTGERTIDALAGMCARLRKRVVTGRLHRAGGAA